MLDRSKVMVQMKRDTLVIQVRGCTSSRLGVAHEINILITQKKIMLRNPPRCLSCKNSRKTKNKMGGHPEGCTTNSRNMRIQETSWGLK
jgi:hypothetical protein